MFPAAAGQFQHHASLGKQRIEQGTDRRSVAFGGREDQPLVRALGHGQSQQGAAAVLQ